MLLLAGGKVGSLMLLSGRSNGGLDQLLLLWLLGSGRVGLLVHSRRIDSTGDISDGVIVASSSDWILVMGFSGQVGSLLWLRAIRDSWSWSRRTKGRGRSGELLTQVLTLCVPDGIESSTGR